ncbi:sugar 3,4-ketoisomerase [Bacteroidetes bacterium endosymbiont of Geopemphigus sp.]|uniref:sugar 3,4-ketoisomerase n=1 Tax=Bacteroidetes bacterium endosymbiont of Geopemphigus sp. TaxID=2047937 RepID=UPI000CD1F98C|nr:FdtA/QdtA family cupin domain-containing protein [Bacteroidetes bacterium endosymbiont of Geopemphigus sp.]
MRDIDNSLLIELSNFSDGVIRLENKKDIPFEMKRIYYLYELSTGQIRGAHAHKKLQQLMIALKGSFDVILDNGEKKKVFHLDHAGYGLLIEPGIWHEMKNFSFDTVCLILASMKYNENDYIRDYREFLNM